MKLSPTMNVLLSPSLVHKPSSAEEEKRDRMPCADASNAVVLATTMTRMPATTTATKRPRPKSKSTTKKKARCRNLFVAEHPLSSSKSTLVRRVTVPAEPDLSPESIQKRALHLFSTKEGLLSRIFSCYSLILESNNDNKSAPWLSTAATPLRRSLRTREHELQFSGPLWSLLQALVQVEVSLNSSEQDSSSNNNNKSSRIQFCGFNGSALLPPVDRIEGSCEHLSQVLEALMKVHGLISTFPSASIPSLQHLVDSLTPNYDPMTQNGPSTLLLKPCLKQGSVENLLTRLPTEGESTSSLVEACARSISADYPIKRVQDAVNLYHSDLTLLLQRLHLPSQQAGSMLMQKPCQQFLNVEQFSARLLGSAIRFHLRMLFNPAPPRLGKADVAYDQRSLSYSRVSECVKLVGGDEQSSAIQEVNVATLVNKALANVYGYLGDDTVSSNLSTGTTLEELKWSPQSSSPSASLQQLLENVLEKPRALDKTPELVESLKQIGDDGARFLACYNGARFLVDLFQLEVVQKEFDRRNDSVKELETYASWLWQFELFLVPDCTCDAPLVLLSDVPSFIQQLQQWTTEIQPQADDCLAKLKALQKRVKQWRKAQRYELDTWLEERLAFAQYLPRVEEAILEDDDAEEEAQTSQEVNVV